MKPEKDHSVFDQETSMALKGIAIMMLLLHHTFSIKSHYEGYIVSFYPLAETQVHNIGMACKICVSIFAFITGYGLFLSFGKHEGKISKWCARRYVRTFSGYWFVWILTAIVCQLIDGNTLHFFLRDGGYNGFIYSLLDFLGTSMLFMQPRLMGSTWYMSTVIIFILLIPLIYRWKDELWFFLAMHVVFLRVVLSYDGSLVNTGYTTIFSFITPFLLGCLFAKYGWIDQWIKIGSGSLLIKIYKLLAESWLLIFGYKLYQNTPWNTFWDYHFGLFPVLVIIFCIEFITAIPGLRLVLYFLGRHSMNIFLVHSTLKKYLRDFIFSRGHFMICMMTLLLLSILVSLLIEELKKAVQYKKLVSWLEKKADGI